MKRLQESGQKSYENRPVHLTNYCRIAVDVDSVVALMNVENPYESKIEERHLSFLMTLSVVLEELDKMKIQVLLAATNALVQDLKALKL